jgi:hypothetical protein
MRPDHENLVVHEGLTDLKQMRLGMFKTVLRFGVRVLLFIFFCALIYSLMLLLF